VIEKGDTVRCTGQLTLTKKTPGDDVAGTMSNRINQEYVQATEDAPEGTFTVVGFFGRFASLNNEEWGTVTAWPTDQLMKEA
jgi:hypothetical protein